MGRSFLGQIRRAARIHPRSQLSYFAAIAKYLIISSRNRLPNEIGRLDLLARLNRLKSYGQLISWRSTQHRDGLPWQPCTPPLEGVIKPFLKIFWTTIAM